MEYYAILGVSHDAEEDDIRSAYKALALRWHPDRQIQNAAEATGKFVEINNAYKGILRDRRRAQRKVDKQDETPVPSTSRMPPAEASASPRRTTEEPSEPPSDSAKAQVRQYCKTSSTCSASTTAHSSGSSDSSCTCPPKSSRDNRNVNELDTRKDHDKPLSSSSSSSSRPSSSRSSVSSLFEDHKCGPTRENRGPSEHGSRDSYSSTAPSSTSAPSSHRSASHKPSPATSTGPPRACVYTCYTSSSNDNDDDEAGCRRSSRSSLNSTWSFREAEKEHRSGSRSQDRHSSSSSENSRRDGGDDHRSRKSKCSRSSSSSADSESVCLQHRDKDSRDPKHETKSTHSGSRSSVKSGSSKTSMDSDATSMYTDTAPIFEMPEVPRSSDHSRSSSKSADLKLDKQSKPVDGHLDSQSSKSKPSMHHRESSDADNHSERVLLPEYDPPLLRQSGGPKEWVFPLSMSLEEIYKGRKFCLRVIRYKLSGKKKNVMLNFKVPPGCPVGTKIIFKGCGHELVDGTKQDLVFLIEEEVHEKFTRDHDDLFMDVRLPWLDSLNDEMGEVHLNGVDGKPLSFKIDFAKHKAYHGATAIPDAGMCRRDGSGRRGNLIVRWEIVRSPPSRWESIKNVLSFKKG